MVSNELPEEALIELLASGDIGICSPRKLRYSMGLSSLGGMTTGCYRVESACIWAEGSVFLSLLEDEDGCSLTESLIAMLIYSVLEALNSLLSLVYLFYFY